MNEFDTDTNADPAEPAPPAGAGALLRRGRESTGLSIDTVAQQLKLAPRQVRAIEDADFAHLPGRTFVRGFVRNYARLLHLDPETVLAALPAAAAAPTLEAPALQPTSRSIGELPTAETSRSGWTRWAIPLTLIAIVAAAALYEFMRPAGDARREAPKAVSAEGEPAVTAKPATDHAGTPLPNPVITGERPDAPAAAVPATDTLPGSASSATTSAAEAPLTLAFRGLAWVEVKDRSGKVLLSQMNSAGTTQSVSGTPPFDLVIGNAGDVTLTFRGKRIDLAPHSRQGIARLTLE